MTIQAKNLVELLKASGKTCATAESCTGGMIGSLITAVPGASKVFYGGIISYDNSVKKNVLGVEKNVLEEYGAVSKECVEQMAIGARKALNTTYAIATSGIAGPSGGTPDKPVGTVWIAWATPEGTIAECFKFGVARERKQITQRAVTTALVKMIHIIQGKTN